jgi:6-pyruvoyltetrahydropterin/6-carboxytetrahydropterin synthase
MHKLARAVRFSINPFLADDGIGFNSYASKPAGEGLSMFFELCVELSGGVEPTTGFVVNVTDIDKAVRQFVVPIFAGRIRDDFRQGMHIGFVVIAEVLKAAWGELADRFGSAKPSKLSLLLNPFRKVAVEDEDCEMIYFSEKFEFAAMHKLWNDDFSKEKNLAVFGKCANPTGHGHNYVIEVTVKTPKSADGFRIGEFEKVIDGEFITLVDHKNLNADVAELSQINPTIENIAVFAWDKLVGKFGTAELHCVTVWETDKTYCSYTGQ